MARREKTVAQATVKIRSKSRFKNCHFNLELSVKSINICQDTSTAFRGLFAQGLLPQSHISLGFRCLPSPPRWLQTTVSEEEEGAREQALGEKLWLESSIPWPGTREKTVNSDKKQAGFGRWGGSLCGVPSSRREGHGCCRSPGEDAVHPKRVNPHSAWRPGCLCRLLHC